MKRQVKLCLVFLAALAGGASAAALSLQAHEGHGVQAKHHHDLRGVITQVETEKNQFEIKTDAGHVVLCLIDDQSTLKRGSQKINLKDVQPGERARCHCVSLRDGRHYSQSLLLEPAKHKKKQKEKAK